MLFNLKRELGHGSNGHEPEYGSAAAPEARRRRTDAILARWDAHRRTGMLPAWADHLQVAGTGLAGFCVAGHFGYDRAQVVTTRIGEHFLERLNSRREDSDHAAYAAAVVMGVILTESEQLFHDPYPLVRDGEFLNLQSARIRYRTIVLPFGENKRTADHWLALGCWAMTGEKVELVRSA